MEQQQSEENLRGKHGAWPPCTVDCLNMTKYGCTIIHILFIISIKACIGHQPQGPMLLVLEIKRRNKMRSQELSEQRIDSFITDQKQKSSSTSLD